MSNRKTFVSEDERWITVKGTHVLVDDDGVIQNKKLRKKIEATSGNSKSKDK
jgi:hypothetical protein